MVTANRPTTNGNEELVVKSKKVIKKLIIFYLLIGVFCFFLFQAKWLAFLICLLQLVFALYLYDKSKGVITIDYDTKSPQPSLFFPLLIPSVVLFATGIIDITVLDYTFFWFPFAFYLFIFLLVIIKLIRKNEGEKKIGSIVTSFILGAAFSFGVTINSNEALSLKPSEQHKSQIVDKWMVESRNTTYHFKLSPWGPMKNSNCIKVLQYEYDKLQLGDSVTIEYNSGLYQIPLIKLIDTETNE